eukprot:scaffold48870_cov270-Isochrysis_galbana.AAC.3
MGRAGFALWMACPSSTHQFGAEACPAGGSARLLARLTPAGHTHTATSSAIWSTSSSSPRESERSPSSTPSAGPNADADRRSNAGAVCGPGRDETLRGAEAGRAARKRGLESSVSDSNVQTAVSGAPYCAASRRSSSAGDGANSTAMPCARPTACAIPMAPRSALATSASRPPAPPSSCSTSVAMAIESSTPKLLKASVPTLSLAPGSQARMAQSFPPREWPNRTVRSAGHGPRPSASQAAVAARNVRLTWAQRG